MSIETADSTPKSMWKNPFVWAFIGGAIFLTALRPLQERLFLRAPDPLVRPGAWSLVDDKGAAYGTKELAGKVVVADFFFTRCPSVCPRLTAELKRVVEQTRADDDRFRFVSFSVDPQNDTPEALTAYRARNGATDPRWVFLGGAPEDVRKVLVDQLKVGIGEMKMIDETRGLYDIAHQNRFALLDQNGDVRGLFDVNDESLRQMMNAARLLADHGPNP